MVRNHPSFYFLASCPLLPLHRHWLCPPNPETPSGAGPARPMGCSEVKRLTLSPCWLYECPITATTNDHTANGLKQHTFSISQFCRSESPCGSHWAKIKGSAGLPSFQRLWGESISFPFRLLESSPHSPSTNFSTSNSWSWPVYLAFFSLSPSTFKDSCD